MWLINWKLHFPEWKRRSFVVKISPRILKITSSGFEISKLSGAEHTQTPFPALPPPPLPPLGKEDQWSLVDTVGYSIRTCWLLQFQTPSFKHLFWVHSYDLFASACKHFPRHSDRRSQIEKYVVVSVRSSLPPNVQQSFLNQSLDPHVPSNQKRPFFKQSDLLMHSLTGVGAFANSNAGKVYGDVGSTQLYYCRLQIKSGARKGESLRNSCLVISLNINVL